MTIHAIPLLTFESKSAPGLDSLLLATYSLQEPTFALEYSPALFKHARHVHNLKAERVPASVTPSCMQDPPWELLSSPITQTSPANAQREKFQFFSGNADGSHSPYMTSGSASAYNLSTPMVSHSYSAEPPRRPPSVSSRSTTTRRHRNHRSHHGGSSYAPQNEFPNFANTGDVEIIVNHEGQEKRYMLHRLILAQCSGFFEASTSEEWSRAQAQSLIQGAAQGPDRALGRIGEEEETGGPSRRPGPVPHAGHRPRWRYELDSETQEDEVPMLIQKVRIR